MTAKSLKEALREGGRVGLEALRDHLVDKIEPANGRDSAALSGRLLDVMTRLEGMPEPAKETPRDELAARRASGERVTARPARARRG